MTPRTFSRAALITAIVTTMLGCAEGPETGSQDDDLKDTRESYALGPDDLFPEGGAYDPVDRAFFVGSLAHGTITRVARSGESHVFFAGAAGNVTLGMKVDDRRHRLYVCALRSGAGKEGLVWSFDLASGQRLGELALESAAPHASCNDLAIAKDGSIYVTDRENPNVYRVDGDLHAASVWASDPLLAPERVGQNGIAVTPDNETLLVTKYMPAKLIRISLQGARDLAEVKLTGDPLSGGPLGAASGADGIAFLGDSLYMAFDRSLMKIVPADPSFRAATVTTRAVGFEHGMTAVIPAAGQLYVANGQSPMFLLGLPPQPFRLVRIPLTAFE